MSSKLLIDILDEKVSWEDFHAWISGTNDQVITSYVNKSDFVLHLLNYIQEETNKFVVNSTPAPQVRGKNESTPQSKEESLPNEKTMRKSPEKSVKKEELVSQNRSPFKKLNKQSPAKEKAQPRCLNFANDAKRDLFNSPTNQDSRNVMSSTPVHNRRNSGYESFPAMSPKTNDSLSILSPKSINSFHSDLSSPSPHSPHRFNSSSGSHRFSSPSNSPTLSASNFPELGSRSRPRTPQSPCLADFIVSKPQKNKRRIKPTQLTATPDKNTSSGPTDSSNHSFGSVNRPFTSLVSPVQPPAELKEMSNFDEERNLLKEKRIQILNRPKETPVKAKSQEPESPLEELKGLLHKNKINANESYKPIDPNPSLTSSADKVVRLASVYSACCDLNMVPNVISELFMIFTLLTYNYQSKETSSAESPRQKQLSESSVESVAIESLSISESRVNNKDEAKSVQSVGGVLGSVHNCVMFASAVIERLLPLIECLDKTVVKLLLENTRLSLFVPHIIPQLVHIAESKDKQENESSPQKKLSVLTNGPVLYQADTDKKENFSTEANFNVFKKQRDAFYNILHEWRTKHADGVWLARSFPTKVQNLMSLSSDPVNLMHLARLFCAQLTSYNNEQEESELVGVSKDKLSRLQARFHKGPDSPRPPPQFPGEQQFYQQFLQLTTGYPFSVHVSNCLAHRLIVLNTTKFFVDGERTEESLQSCLSDCCLLAKFLGLVQFAPYSCETTLNPATLQAHILLRQHVSSPLDLVSCLESALEKNRLVLTVLWLVSYLGMMDVAAPHLPLFRPVLCLLVSLYSHLPLPHVSPLTSLLLRTSLGWLFDISFFPEALFYSLLSEKAPLKSWSGEPADVDVKDCVDQTLLLELCPYMTHLRLPLLQSSGQSSKRSTPRHITPVSASLKPSTTQSSFLPPALTLQMQLEESFFSGQSASFRASAEFLMDKVSASCLRYISHSVIPSCKQQLMYKIRKEGSNTLNKKQIREAVDQACSEARTRVETAMNDYCGTHLETACRLVVGCDTNDPAVVCSMYAICSRRCKERIISRLNASLNLREMFSKITNSKTDANKSTDTSVPITSSRCVEHRNSASSPPDLLILLQNTVCSVIERKVVGEEEIVMLLQKACESMNHRLDLFDAAEQVIQSTSVDLCLVLLATSPQLVSAQVTELLCSLWSLAGQSPLETLVSSRNLLLLCQAGPDTARTALLALADLLVTLLKLSLLTPASVEAQFCTLLRKEWPQPVLDLVNTCLTSLIEKIKNDPLCKKKPKFVLMLEVLSEMLTHDTLTVDDNLDEMLL